MLKSFGRFHTAAKCLRARKSGARVDTPTSARSENVHLGAGLPGALFQRLIGTDWGDRLGV